MTDPVEVNEMQQSEVELEQWLGDQAKNEVPDVGPNVLLRDYADDIEQLGYGLSKGVTVGPNE